MSTSTISVELGHRARLLFFIVRRCHEATMIRFSVTSLIIFIHYQLSIILQMLQLPQLLIMVLSQELLKTHHFSIGCLDLTFAKTVALDPDIASAEDVLAHVGFVDGNLVVP